MPCFLEVRNLCKQFGSLRALDGVSFEVAGGELFGLLGPNGAGKTTLMSILGCTAEPSAGEARLEGRKLHTGNRDAKRRIGVVPQDTALYEDLTARENLALFGQLYGVRGGELGKRIDELLAAFGLDNRADDRVARYSGGMKRRLNLAAALVHRPDLLLLDEPTVGVDPQSRARIFEEIRRLNAAGVTIVYSSHYMEEVQTLCRRVGILDQGKLIALDGVDNLLRLLNGLIRLGVPAGAPRLQDELAQVAGVAAVRQHDGVLELECRDVKAVLGRIAASLAAHRIELTHLETVEPNLERVFLHLTGRALRD